MTTWYERAAELRTSAQMRRRRTNVFVLATAVALAVGAGIAALVWPKPEPPLEVTDLSGVSLSLPPWPDNVPPGAAPCPRDRIDLSGPPRKEGPTVRVA